jgi:hypothetical protein
VLHRRRAGVLGEVVDTLLGEVDVGGEGRGPQGVDDDLAGVQEPHDQDRADHRGQGDHGRGGQDAAGAAGPELADRDATGDQDLAEQQPRDQVARDDEEDVDADEAPGQGGHPRVGADHHSDCDRAQSLDVAADLSRHLPRVPHCSELVNSPTLT